MKQPTDDTVHKNIRAIYEHEKAQLAEAGWSQRMARRVTAWSSHVAAIWIHIAFFTAWILINTFIWKFDPYPFTMLTTTVSLESIFLSLFVLISQNDMSIEADRRHKLDLQVNLLAETESTVSLRLLDKIAKKLGIEDGARADAQRLSDDTNPKEILAEIVKTEEK